MEQIKPLFYQALLVTDDDKIAAAVLTLAAIIANQPPEIVEPDNSYTVKEAARRLNLSSKQVYLMAIAGQLRSFKRGKTIRVPADEIERHQHNPRRP